MQPSPPTTLYPTYQQPQYHPQPPIHSPNNTNQQGYYYRGFNFNYGVPYPQQQQLVPSPQQQQPQQNFQQQPQYAVYAQPQPQQQMVRNLPSPAPLISTPATPSTPQPNALNPKIKPLGKKYIMNVDKIGHGTFASVYEGWRVSDNSKIAIKKIDIPKLKPEMVKYLDFEMEIMKHTNHENILKLFEVINTKGGAICLVLEFMDGGELGKYIKSKNFLSEEEAKSFLWDLAKGLYCLHSGGAVHRDLKPANLLLKKNEDGSMTLKIADLGLGRNIDQSEPMNYTQVGTPLYMSPEILNGTKYGTNVDLWAVGAIFYEMVTGKTLFFCNNLNELLNLVNNVPVVPPSSISPEAKNLMIRLLERDPKKRITTEDFVNHPFFDSIRLKKPMNMNQRMNVPKSIYEDKDLLGSTFIVIPPSPQIPTESNTPSSPQNLKKNGITMAKNNEELYQTKYSLAAQMQISNTTVRFSKLILPYKAIGKDEVDTEGERQWLTDIENKVSKAWSIAEVAFLHEHFQNYLESLVLYELSLHILYNSISSCKTVLSSKAFSPTFQQQLHSLLLWIKNVYTDITKRTEDIISIPATAPKMKERFAQLLQQKAETNLIPPAELLLYTFVVKLSKEAIVQDLLNGTTSKLQSVSLEEYKIMLMRCNWLVDFLLVDYHQIVNEKQMNTSSLLTAENEIFLRKLKLAMEHLLQ